MEGELQSKAGGKEFLPNSKQRAIQGVKMLQSGDTNIRAEACRDPIPLSTSIVRATPGLTFWQMLERSCWFSLGNSNIGLYWALSDQEICRAHFWVCWFWRCPHRQLRMEETTRERGGRKHKHRHPAPWFLATLKWAAFYPMSSYSHNALLYQYSRNKTDKTKTKQSQLNQDLGKDESK